MAKITFGEEREIEGSYNLYRQPSFAGDMLAIRRKVAMPSDVEHNSSRATIAQRKRFASASKRWASLPPLVKAELSKQKGWVWQHHSPEPSTPKLLEGQQLFISQEIHAIEYHQTHAETPMWLCTRTLEPTGILLPFYIDLWYQSYKPSTTVHRHDLAPGNTLFPLIRKTPYIFGMGEVDWYDIGRSPTRYYYKDLNNLREVIVCPPLLQYALKPGPGYSYTTDFNWLYQMPVGPNALWRCISHNIITWDPPVYDPLPICSFTASLHGDNQVKVTITPLNIYYQYEYFNAKGLASLRYWKVDPMGGGIGKLTPDHPSVIVNRPDGTIDHYQD